MEDFVRNRTTRLSRFNVHMMMAMAVVGVSALAPMAKADQSKAAGSANLDQLSAWVNNQLPTASDVAIFDSNFGTSPNSWLLGSRLKGAVRMTLAGGGVVFE